MPAPKLAAFAAAVQEDGTLTVHVGQDESGTRKVTPVLKFDRAAPDPSPRAFSFDPELYVGAGLSERCGMNALETGLRVLCGGPAHPRAFLVEGCLVWASQYTKEVVS